MDEFDSSKQRLNAYIYDFLVKSALHGTARAFLEETGLRCSGAGGVSGDGSSSSSGSSNSGSGSGSGGGGGGESAKNGQVAVVDSPQGYLYEWWKIFWDLCSVSAKQRGGENAGLAAIQAYHEAWSEKSKQAAAHRAQEIQAASLQRMAEDSGEYRDETVDVSKLALVVSSVPLQASLRRSSTPALTEAGRLEEPPTVTLEKEPRALSKENYQDIGTGTGTSSTTNSNADGMNANANHIAVSSQELPSFDLQGFENDPDYLIFTSPETAPLPIDFPPIPGEDTSFLDNSNERTFNFLNSM